MATVTCPSCGGKGHVLDAAVAVLLPVFGWILAPFERNNPAGVTRETCQQCEGRGYVTRPDDGSKP